VAALVAPVRGYGGDRGTVCATVPHTVRIANLSLLAVAILGGVVLAALHRRGRVPPWYLAAGHGSVGVAALVVLGVDLYADPFSTLEISALVCLVFTAATAFVFFALRLMRKKVPLPLIALHGSLAVVGSVLLLADHLTRG